VYRLAASVKVELDGWALLSTRDGLAQITQSEVVVPKVATTDSHGDGLVGLVRSISAASVVLRYQLH